jgi:hypothetical protein
LSQKDRDRLMILRQVHPGELPVSEGAQRAQLCTRQVRRLLRRFEEEGEAVVIHGLRGRSSNRRLEPGLREKALSKARQELYREFGPTLLACPDAVHLDDPGGPLKQPQGKRRRKKRERRAACGELVLMDPSIHAWLEDRSSDEIVLIALIDDATSRLTARFFPRDTGAANRQLIVDYLEAHGRMGAIYADRASHFKAHFRSTQRR